MTASQQRIVDLLGDAWNAFAGQPSSDDDRNDFRKAIHDAQRIVMAAAVRQEPATDAIAEREAAARRVETAAYDLDGDESLGRAVEKIVQQAADHIRGGLKG